MLGVHRGPLLLWASVQGGNWISAGSGGDGDWCCGFVWCAHQADVCNAISLVCLGSATAGLDGEHGGALGGMSNCNLSLPCRNCLEWKTICTLCSKLLLPGTLQLEDAQG